MAKTAIKRQPRKAALSQPQQAEARAKVPDKARQTYNKNTIASIYLITSVGVTMLMGKDGDELRERIKQDKEHESDYKFFDDDKKVWAYWAVADGNGGIDPPSFPPAQQYALTALQLYTKAVTYPRILAHAVGLLKDKPQTLWDKMLKPATIIMAIVGIMFVMGLMLLALTG